MNGEARSIQSFERKPREPWAVNGSVGPVGAVIMLLISVQADLIPENAE